MFIVDYNTVNIYTFMNKITLIIYKIFFIGVIIKMKFKGILDG